MPRLVALEPEALVAGLERRVDEAVRLRHERLDLALALDDHRRASASARGRARRRRRPTRGRGSSRRASRSCRRASRPRSGSARPPRAAASASPGRSLSKPSRIACFVIERDPEPLDGLALARCRRPKTARRRTRRSARPRGPASHALMIRSTSSRFSSLSISFSCFFAFASRGHELEARRARSAGRPCATSSTSRRTPPGRRAARGGRRQR